jgi:hypothetical protein
MHAEIAQFPVMVAHADWSMHPSKRWLAKATLRPSRRYFALPPEPVKSLIDLFARLGSSGEGAILLGVDFPIGLPRTYADRAGIDDFVAFLPQFGVDPWHDFYKVANHSAEICIARPFYPHASGKKGTVSVSHLLKGLGMAAPDELRRRCDRATPARPAASALFWTLGAKQVGRAAIAGWRELLVPALRNGLDLAMWPFHGDLDRLLNSHRYVIAERPIQPRSTDICRCRLSDRAVAASGARRADGTARMCSWPSRATPASIWMPAWTRRSAMVSARRRMARIRSMRRSACSAC